MCFSILSTVTFNQKHGEKKGGSHTVTTKYININTVTNVKHKQQLYLKKIQHSSITDEKQL